MSKTVLLILFAIFTNTAFGQLAVAQMEAEWRCYYQKGYTSFNDSRYQDAARDFISSIELLKTNGAENTLFHIYSLIKLSETYYALNDKVNLTKLTNQINNIKTKIRPGSKTYIIFLFNLSIFYSNTNQFELAKKTLEEALSYENVLKDIQGIKLQILHRLAMCSFFMGNIDEAINKEKQCVDLDAEFDPIYKKSLVYYYCYNKDWEQLEMVLPDCYNNAREASLRFFSTRRADERSSFWSTEGLFFTEFMPTYVASHPSPIMTSYAYNAALFSKGVLLAAENKSAEIILNSNDTELISAYQKYLDLRGKKNKSIDDKAELLSLSELFFQYQKDHKKVFREDFRIGWQDVKEKISDSDIAIEFIMMPSVGKQVKYAALSLRNDYTAPHFIEIGEIDFTSNPYIDEELYKKIWQPLERELDNVDNIYFSPIGELCNTGIEYLVDEDGNELCSKYNTYRLSSTKEIVLRKNKDLKKCVLIGGINYDAPISVMTDQTESLDFAKNDYLSQNIDSLELRTTKANGGLSFLEGSEKEVYEINKIMSNHHVICDMLVGDVASETIFKNMSGCNSDIIHIATHGFYYANRQYNKRKTIDELYRDLNLHFRSNDVVVINEEKMLTRSGLLLAGANNVLQRRLLPKGVEDGILYAEEISHLDLSHIDLLVLSSCQSGLGDIAASEGVFGLQRGFKRAGVNSIVMSLWKVDDKATEILMTAFYDNLSKGLSKRESLFNAQLTLRTVDDGRYDAPQFWAAFVLLDGIN